MSLLSEVFMPADRLTVTVSPDAKALKGVNSSVLLSSERTNVPVCIPLPDPLTVRRETSALDLSILLPCRTIMFVPREFRIECGLGETE
jgi:hypothetical protein